MQQCDGVTVSTQRLATIVRSFTSKPVRGRAETAIDLAVVQEDRSRPPSETMPGPDDRLGRRPAP
jgi:hypothetical protein